MSIKRSPHPPSSLNEKKGCRGHWTLDTGWGSEFECGYGSSIGCEDCIYGACGGEIDPEAAAAREDDERFLTKVHATYRKMREKAQSSSENAGWAARLADDRIEPFGQWVARYRRERRKEGLDDVQEDAVDAPGHTNEGR